VRRFRGHLATQREAEGRYRKLWFKHIDDAAGPDAHPDVISALDGRRAAQKATARAYLGEGLDA
jgi:hypothetical protein